MKRDLLRLADLSRSECEQILTLAVEIKNARRTKTGPPLLPGTTLAMIFEKPSLRTRISFATGIFQLGGMAIHLAPHDIQLGARETTPDVARTLARMVDIIVARTFLHDTVAELAAHATVPVINGLSDLHHPCQILADLLTLVERRHSLDGLKVAFVGDGNNVFHSWMEAAARFGLTLALACPAGYDPDPAILEACRSEGATIEITHKAADAVQGADVVYSDVWTSMGQEDEAAARRRTFADYQINEALMRYAAKNAVIMHCLPAHRGEEITAEALEGPQSIVFDQAENRLHAQKALMVWLLEQSR
jgi:ornithine carbamoyltransferase